MEWHDLMRAAFESGGIIRRCPWLVLIIEHLPHSIAKHAAIGQLLALREDIENQVKSIMEDRDNRGDDRSRVTIFHSLLESDLPPQEKTLDRLVDEGQIVIGAGTETTANTLTMIAFHAFWNQDILQKLRRDINSIKGEKLKWNRLEQLPYLSAVITEGLRLAGGITYRIPRVAPNEVLKYNDWEVPAGTPVSTTPFYTLMNPSIFPNPRLFDPDRGIRASKSGQRLDKYMVSFGKGRRRCAGEK